MKEFEIWIGYYHLGQGYDPSRKPEHMATIDAVDFKTACLKHELMTSLQQVIREEITSGYVNEQTANWFYSYKTNSNSWTGKYYESEAEALASFG